MKRFLFFLLIAVFSTQTYAAESLTPRVAQRVLMILERAQADPAQTLANLKELIESRPENSSDRGFILYERAVLLIQQEQTELARQEISTLLAGQEDGYVPRLRFLLGQLYLMANEPLAALEQLSIWMANVESPRASELAIVAYTNIQLEYFDAGAVALERAIAAAEEPQNQWLELLAYCYTRVNRSEEALGLIERLIAQEPANARWWRQLASIYLLLENVPKGAAGLAVSSYLKEMDFNDTKNLAILFNTLGMPADGAQVLETSFNANPDSVDFEDHMLLGELWMLAREFEHAVGEFNVAATMDVSGEARWRLAQLYIQRENYAEAETALAESIAGYGEEVPPQLYYLLAVVAINLEDFDSANSALSRIENNSVYAGRAEQLNSYIDQVLAQRQVQQ